MIKKILFTGGGTAGHVTLNMALIDACQQKHWQVAYIGSKDGIERQLIQPLNIIYKAITCDKLRRQFSWKTFIMPFKVLYGMVQSYVFIRQFKPDVVFSKGGFVALPVVIAAWLNRVPVIAHESDLTPGLTTKLCQPFAKKLCVTFEASKQYFKPSDKIIYTGSPLRKALLTGEKTKGLALCGFTDEKPVILVMGGSLGALRINQVLREALPDLLQDYQIIHLCGRGKVDESLKKQSGYQQFDYVNEALPDLLAAADVVISRAGANTIVELLTLKKPTILIPLSSRVSRGDQIANAKYCSEKGLFINLPEHELTKDHLRDQVQQLFKQKQQYINQLNAYPLPDSIGLMMDLFEKL